MTELRKKMIRAMELQNLSKNSQKSYLNAVSGLANYYMQSPDQLSKEMTEDYLLRKTDLAASWDPRLRSSLFYL